MKKYLLVHIDRTTGDEDIYDAYDILLIEPQTIVDDSYNYMCLSDRKNTIVELRELVDYINYNVLASMDYEKEVKKFFMKESEDND